MPTLQKSSTTQEKPFLGSSLQMVWHTEDDTQAFARQWAARLSNAHVIVFLQGNLGAGKTTFTRHLLKALGFEGRVKSPTYTLLETYSLPTPNTTANTTATLTSTSTTDAIGMTATSSILPTQSPAPTSTLMLYHFDLYRLQDPQEWEDAGFRDVFASPGIKLVEWPDKAVGLISPPDVTLHFDLQDEHTRQVQMQAHTPAGQAVWP